MTDEERVWLGWAGLGCVCLAERSLEAKPGRSCLEGKLHC